MNEDQVLSRIYAVTGQGNRALLARFWLLMDASSTQPAFTFADLRHLDGEGRSVFHSILSSYRRNQFAPLDMRLVSCLNELGRSSYYRSAMSSAMPKWMYYYPARARSAVDALPAGHKGVTP